MGRRMMNRTHDKYLYVPQTWLSTYRCPQRPNCTKEIIPRTQRARHALLAFPRRCRQHPGIPTPPTRTRTHEEQHPSKRPRPARIIHLVVQSRVGWDVVVRDAIIMAVS